MRLYNSNFTRTAILSYWTLLPFSLFFIFVLSLYLSLSLPTFLTQSVSISCLDVSSFILSAMQLEYVLLLHFYVIPLTYIAFETTFFTSLTTIQCKCTSNEYIFFIQHSQWLATSYRPIHLLSSLFSLLCCTLLCAMWEETGRKKTIWAQRQRVSEAIGWT